MSTGDGREEPAPLPPLDDSGCRLRTGLGAERRALARRAVARPLALTAGGVLLFALLG
jgi:hypothetical protein